MPVFQNTVFVARCIVWLFTGYIFLKFSGTKMFYLQKNSIQYILHFRMSLERTTGWVSPTSLDSVHGFQSKMCSIFHYLNSSVVTDVLSLFILHIHKRQSCIYMSHFIALLFSPSKAILYEPCQKLFNESGINTETSPDPSILNYLWCKRWRMISFVLTMSY